MKIKIYKPAQYILIAFLAGTLAIISCGKNNDPSVTNSFTWTYAGITYTARLDTAYKSIVPFFPLILATAGNSLFSPPAEVQIGLISFNTGTYTFTSGGTNIFQFTDPLGFSHSSTGGSLTISTNTSTTISGNFSANLTSGKTITGNFSNMSVKP